MEDILIFKAKEGDDDACKKVINEYTRLIYSIINNYHLEYGDYSVSKEDLFQEGCIALLEACKTFKQNGNTKFSTYAYIVIKRRVIREYYKMVKPYHEEFSFDKYEMQDHMDFFSNRCVSDNELSYTINEKRYDLKDIDFISKEDKKIIELRMQNYSYKEISELLNISIKRVDNRLSRIRKTCKKKYALPN